ncbi:unnamed protein product [Soboliphyme baturini]|uniref:Uncharacterized protein n=1 Tax=Soboliphyme baturini TaxID=241478 RepID=A0A183IYI2_9BILA|nr:unnamed protein product [Soboliphyme baturini]
MIIRPCILLKNSFKGRRRTSETVGLSSAGSDATWCRSTVATGRQNEAATKATVDEGRLSDDDGSSGSGLITPRPVARRSVIVVRPPAHPSSLSPPAPSSPPPSASRNRCEVALRSYSDSLSLIEPVDLKQTAAAAAKVVVQQRLSVCLHDRKVTEGLPLRELASSPIRSVGSSVHSSVIRPCSSRYVPCVVPPSRPVRPVSRVNARVNFPDSTTDVDRTGPDRRKWTDLLSRL